MLVVICKKNESCYQVSFSYPHTLSWLFSNLYLTASLSSPFKFGWTTIAFFPLLLSSSSLPSFYSSFSSSPTLIVQNNQFRVLEWWSVKQFKFYCPSELIRSIRVGVEMKLIAVSQDRVQINKTLNFIAGYKMHACTPRWIHTHPWFKKNKTKKNWCPHKKIEIHFHLHQKKQKKNMHACIQNSCLDTNIHRYRHSY